MKLQLKSEGVDVHLVVVNMTGMADLVSNLVAQGDFPIFQDSDALGAWKAHGAGKDDLIVYSKQGKLLTFLPFGGSVQTGLSGEPGWSNVKKAWSDAAKAP